MLLWDEDVSQHSVLSVPWMESTAVMYYNPVPQSAEPILLLMKQPNQNWEFLRMLRFQEVCVPVKYKIYISRVLFYLKFTLKYFPLGKWTVFFHIPDSRLSWMPQLSAALRSCSWRGKISASPDYSPAVTEGSVTVPCVRASAADFPCSICKILHILTHTCINICTPKMRLPAGRKDYLGCYRADSSQHPLGGASALRYCTPSLYIVGRIFLRRHWMLFILIELGEAEEEQSWKTGLLKALYSLYSKH